MYFLIVQNGKIVGYSKQAEDPKAPDFIPVSKAEFVETLNKERIAVPEALIDDQLKSKSSYTDFELCQQEITDLQLANLEQGQEITEFLLQALEAKK